VGYEGGTPPFPERYGNQRPESRSQADEEGHPDVGRPPDLVISDI